MKVEDLTKGKRYNFENQPERLVFMGRKFYPGDPRMWLQFAKVESPEKVWSEILQADLDLIEETPEPEPEPKPEPITTLQDFKAAMQLAEQNIAQYVSQRLHELQQQTKVEITGVTVDLITAETLGDPLPTIGGATSIIYFTL